MNRLNLGFMGGNEMDATNQAMFNQAPIPQNVAQPQYLTKPDNKIVKSRFTNKTKKGRNQSSDDDETDINTIVSNIIKKKPSIRKLRKKMRFIMEAMEVDSDDEEF
jgi:hypothetical protein